MLNLIHLRSFTLFASTPGSAPIAFDMFDASFVTNKTLFPTFLLLPLSDGFPERAFLDCNLLRLVKVLVNLVF